MRRPNAWRSLSRISPARATTAARSASGRRLQTPNAAAARASLVSIAVAPSGSNDRNRSPVAGFTLSIGMVLM
jgi:hypothetical protein